MVHRLYDPYHAIRSDPRSIVHPPFDCLVEKVHVKVGQTVKRGDPLLELFSTRLESAKMEYRTALSESERAKGRLRWSRDMNAKGFVSEDGLATTKIAEERSGLGVRLAQDRLRGYGMTEGEIKNIPQEGEDHRARLTLRSRVDGRVTRIAAEAGNHYNDQNDLMVIEPILPTKPTER